jgi:hypothetical protein
LRIPADFVRGKLRFFPASTTRAFSTVFDPPCANGRTWSTSFPFGMFRRFNTARLSRFRFALPLSDPVPLSPRAFCPAYSRA